MAVSMIGPKFYAWDRNGKPLAGGKLYTYQARTNTPKATYQSEDQEVENTNPVILNGEGYANVYLDGSYKMVLKDSKDNEIWSSDPVTSAQADEWTNCLAATYVGPSAFKVAGNQTDIYLEGRTLRINNNATVYEYTQVESAVYAGGETSVVVTDEVITTGLNSVCTSIVSRQSHNSTFNRNVIGAHDDIYIRTVSYDDAVSESSIAPVGTRYLIGGANFQVVDISDNDSDFYRPLNSGKKLKAIKPYSLVGMGVLDDGTDMTSEILSVLEQSAGNKTVVIKTGGDISANWGDVIESMPANVIIDTSGTRTVWRDDSGSYNTKIGFGQLAKDSANNDSLGQIVSGHNAGLQLLNTGGSGSSSGDKRLCSLLFSNRILDPTVSGRAGYQNTAIVQLGQRTSKDYWTYNVRRLAPWEAAGAAFFEFWSEGVVIPAGGYVRSNNQIYKTVSGGTTGASSPSHTSGSVSDGGVLWDWVSTGDTTIFSVTEDGYISNGGAFSVDDLLSLGMTKDGNAAVNWSAKGPSNDVVVRGFPTDAGGNLDLQVPYLRARSASKSLFIEGENGQVIDFTKDNVIYRRGIVRSDVVKTDNASTLSVLGVSSLILSNSIATNITGLVDGTSEQVVEIMATNSNSTLVNSSILRLEGGVDLNMNAFDFITLKRPSTTSAWVEVSRSIK